MATGSIANNDAIFSTIGILSVSGDGLDLLG
jgi:hypothetical protein